jgi:hypothetical protein
MDLDNNRLSFGMSENLIGNLSARARSESPVAYGEDDPEMERIRALTNADKIRMGPDEVELGSSSSSRDSDRRSDYDRRDDYQERRDYQERKDDYDRRSEYSDQGRKSPFEERVGEKPIFNQQEILRGSGASSQDYSRLPSTEVPLIKQISPEEMKQQILKERKTKLRLINKIERYADKGLAIRGNFTLDTPLEDLELEVERLESKNEMDNSVKGYKDTLMFVSGIAELASKYFGIGQIDGYSEQLYTDLYSEPYKYDQVLEDLYEKHRDRPKMAPELKLLMMFGGGMFMYHMSNVMMPKREIRGPEQVDPEMLTRLRREQADNVQQQPQQPQFQQQAQFQQQTQFQQPERNIERKQMSGPQGVDDLLRNLEKQTPGPVSEQEDDAMSYTASEIASGNPRRKRKEKKLTQVFNLDL